MRFLRIQKDCKTRNIIGTLGYVGTFVSKFWLVFYFHQVSSKAKIARHQLLTKMRIIAEKLVLFVRKSQIIDKIQVEKTSSNVLDFL